MGPVCEVLSLFFARACIYPEREKNESAWLDESSRLVALFNNNLLYKILISMLVPHRRLVYVI
jgi:hypothetical protein